MISLYIARSFRRKVLRHFSIFWIMLCAFQLPLVVSVYRDSLNYGRQQQLYDSSKNQAIHILGASAEDVELFRNIDGLTEPFYEDGTIYLTFKSEEAWRKFTDHDSLKSDEDWMSYIDEQNRISGALDSGIAKSGNDLSVLMYEYASWHGQSEDSILKAHMQDILSLNIALLLFSGLIVCSAYRNHIAGFSQEVADLGALGATKGQIASMFLVEFAILFPLAAAGAVGLSWCVMKFLYERFLGNTANSVLIWEVFHMDPKNTALEILFYFLVCLCAMALSVLRSPAKRKIKRRRVKSGSLPALWIHQTKPPFFRCLFILVPLLTAFVLLFNRYLSLYAQHVYGMQETRIVVKSAGTGITQEEINRVSGLNGVQRVEKAISDKLFYLSTPGGNNLTAHIRSCRDRDPQLSLEDFEFAADLYEHDVADGAYYLVDLFNSGERTEVKLAQRIERESQNDQEVNVYVGDALMQKLTADALVTKLEIYTSSRLADSLEEALRNELPGYYSVSNFKAAADITATNQVGRLLLLSWIFCILMLSAMQIIWVRLARYVRDCAPMLRIMFHVGASRKQLSNLIPVWIGAVPAAVLPFAIAIPWAKLEAAQSNRPFIISGPVLGIYLIIGLLSVLTFWGPVKYSLRSVLKEPK